MIIKKLIKNKKERDKICSLNLMALNILFMGTPEFSVPILKSIYDSKHKISEVYTQPQGKETVVKS